MGYAYLVYKIIGLSEPLKIVDMLENNGYLRTVSQVISLHNKVKDKFIPEQEFLECQ